MQLLVGFGRVVVMGDGAGWRRTERV